MAVTTISRSKPSPLRKSGRNGRACLKRKITLAQFYALPDGPPEEYDEGELITLPEAHGRHSDLQVTLITMLAPFVKQNKLGKVWLPINVELDRQHSFGPDLSYLSQDHRDRYDEVKGRIIGAPDLVVEIVSPRGGAARDRVRKFNVYRETGVPWYWIVDAQTLIIEEYRLQAGAYVATARVEPGGVFRPALFPGLEINLQSLLGESS